MEDKKKLLIYAHYFYPDVASTAQILTELAEGLKESFQITVISAVPSYGGVIEEKYKNKKIYDENYKDIRILRVRVPEFQKKNKMSRIKNLFAYFFNSIAATFKVEKQDYIFAISQPPMLGGALGVVGKWIKGGKLIYNIQDFNPEQTMAVGYAKNKVILKCAMMVDKFSCRIADKVIVVGRDMVETLEKRFAGSRYNPESACINNWINENEIYPLPKDNEKVQRFKTQYGLQDKFVIMYSGNIGLYYDLENIIKVIGRFKERNDIVFAFVGAGTVKHKLEEYVQEEKLNNVIFIPYQDKAELIYSLNAADAHFVVNAKGIKGISVPSKIYGVMAAGKAILGVLEEGSEAKNILDQAKCGLCTGPGEYEDIYKMIKSIIDNQEKVELLGAKGRSYLEKYLTKDESIRKYKESILSTGLKSEAINAINSVEEVTNVR